MTSQACATCRANLLREIQETLWKEIKLQEDVSARAKANGFYSEVGEVSGRYAWALRTAADYLACSFRAAPLRIGPPE